MKRGLFGNKKGDEDIVGNQAVFIILNVIIIVIFAVMVGRAVKGATLVEQAYAKQIALIIDQAKPGTVLEIKVEEVFDIADKNGFERESTIKIDNEARKVVVKCTSGKGYSFNFFTDYPVLWSINEMSKTLRIEVRENVA